MSASPSASPNGEEDVFRVTRRQLRLWRARVELAPTYDRDGQMLRGLDDMIDRNVALERVVAGAAEDKAQEGRHTPLAQTGSAEQIEELVRAMLSMNLTAQGPNADVAWLTDEANAAGRWIVKKAAPPFCDARGDRQWSGPTLGAAVQAACTAFGIALPGPGAPNANSMDGAAAPSQASGQAEFMRLVRRLLSHGDTAGFDTTPSDRMSPGFTDDWYALRKAASKCA